MLARICFCDLKSFGEREGPEKTSLLIKLHVEQPICQNVSIYLIREYLAPLSTSEKQRVRVSAKNSLRKGAQCSRTCPYGHSIEQWLSHRFEKRQQSAATCTSNHNGLEVTSQLFPKCHYLGCASDERPRCVFMYGHNRISFSELKRYHELAPFIKLRIVDPNGNHHDVLIRKVNPMFHHSRASISPLSHILLREAVPPNHFRLPHRRRRRRLLRDWEAVVRRWAVILFWLQIDNVDYVVSAAKHCP